MRVTDKKLKDVYKDILHTDNSNTGISSSLKQVTCGDGDTSALYLSTRGVNIRPSSDTTGTAGVMDSDGNTLFKVDSTNDLIKAGIGQHIVNTQYAYFGVQAGDAGWAGLVANTHYAVPFANHASTTVAPQSLGTGTDPASTPTAISAGAHDVMNYWYVPDNITIDAVHWWHGSDAATGDTCRAHLMQYDVVTGTGSTAGDLSNGVVLASGADISNDGYEQAYYQTIAPSTANVDAGKVILFTFRSDSVNSDYSINATIKYHLR